MSDASTIPAYGLYGEQDHYPDVIHCEAFIARAPIHDWRILPHRHSHMSQLFLIETGHVDARVDGVAHQLSDGWFLYVPEHSVHEFRFQPDTAGTVISIPRNVAAAIGPNTQEVLPALARPIAAPGTSTLHTLSQTLLTAAQGAGRFRAQILCGLAHSVLACLAEIQHARADAHLGPAPRRLLQFDALIRAHMAEGWGPSDYAAALSVSTGHLSRLCRAASGMGAAAYLEHKIMDEACRLLAFTQLPVSAVGYRLGYGDPSYFTKRFRAARGQTPSRYRTRFTRS